MPFVPSTQWQCWHITKVAESKTSWPFRSADLGPKALAAESDWSARNSCLATQKWCQDVLIQGESHFLFSSMLFPLFWQKIGDSYAIWYSRLNQENRSHRFTPVEHQVESHFLPAGRRARCNWVKQVANGCSVVNGAYKLHASMARIADVCCRNNLPRNLDILYTSKLGKIRKSEEKCIVCSPVEFL